MLFVCLLVCVCVYFLSGSPGFHFCTATACFTLVFFIFAHFSNYLYGFCVFCLCDHFVFVFSSLAAACCFASSTIYNDYLLLLFFFTGRFYNTHHHRSRDTLLLLSAQLQVVQLKFCGFVLHFLAFIIYVHVYQFTFTHAHTHNRFRRVLFGLVVCLSSLSLSLSLSPLLYTGSI